MPAIWGPVPSRLPDFTGREDWLAAVRYALTRDDRAGVVAIQGLLGVGKTQLALEYAYRYAHAYDVVWWIPGESAHGAMADLAASLGIDNLPADPSERDYGEVFDLLRQDPRYARWLLIFDHVQEPEAIRNLTPSMSGHVLVTTRSSQWEASGEMLELDVFARAESIQFLDRRMSRLDPVTAHRLADGVGDLPLLLEHAVESHLGIDAYLARLDQNPLGLLDDQPADYHASIAGELTAAVDELHGGDALDLLQRLAFFGGEQVPLESLERGSYVQDVSVHQMLRDPFRRLRAIRQLRRAGLLKVGSSTRSFELDRLTRCVVRALVAAPDPERAELARRDVHLLLAAADPLAPDDPATWRTYEELRGHAAESGMTASSHENVQKLVVNLVHFLNATGDPRAALNLAEEAIARWDAASPSGLVLQMAMADALFTYGNRDAAYDLRQGALASMRADPDRWSAEIVQLDGTAGARLRSMGKFSEALTADREAVDAHIAEFSTDDPYTFAAIDSLIADLALAGSAAEALRTATEAYRGCLAFYSDAGHPAVLAAQNVVGRCHWLAGHYHEAIGCMTDVHTGYEELASGGVLDENHPRRLRHEIDYAIVRRDVGRIPGLAEDMHDARRRCWRVLGADHPQTLAATVVLSSILRRVSGQAGEAARLLGDARRRYDSALPGHPYGLLTAVHPAESVPVIQDVVDRLAEAVGGEHPLSLTAIAALANALARSGDVDAALKRGQEALAGLQALFGAGHPHVLAAEANGWTMAHEPVPAELRDRYLAAVGPDHPDLALLARGELIDVDFTPLPLLCHRLDEVEDGGADPGRADGGIDEVDAVIVVVGAHHRLVPRRRRGMHADDVAGEFQVLAAVAEQDGDMDTRRGRERVHAAILRGPG